VRDVRGGGDFVVVATGEDPGDRGDPRDQSVLPGVVGRGLSSRVGVGQIEVEE